MQRQVMELGLVVAAVARVMLLRQASHQLPELARRRVQALDDTRTNLLQVRLEGLASCKKVEIFQRALFSIEKRLQLFERSSLVVHPQLELARDDVLLGIERGI